MKWATSLEQNNLQIALKSACCLQTSIGTFNALPVLPFHSLLLLFLSTLLCKTICHYSILGCRYKKRFHKFDEDEKGFITIVDVQRVLEVIHTPPPHY
jgi:hypothetical protein